MKELTDYPIVSVIIPVYCAEKFIDRCVKSILNQTEWNFELWLIDDGSTDRSGVLCDEWARKDNRIHVIHKKNAGVSAARNDGIRCATGKYIAFVDADDYIEPDMIEQLLRVATVDNSQITICGYYLDKSDSCVPVMPCCEVGRYSGQTVRTIFASFFRSDYTGLASMWNKLYVKSFLVEHGLLVNEKLSRAEDFWFNFEAIQCAQCVSVVHTPLYYYVQNVDSVMHRYRPTQFEDWTRNRLQLLHYAEQLNISIDEPDFFHNYVYNAIVFLLSLACRDGKSYAKQIIREPLLHRGAQVVHGYPLHIAVIVYCIKHKFYGITWTLLKAWGRLKGEVHAR